MDAKNKESGLFESVWKQYTDANSYKQAIGLPEKVRQNENFFIGEQWIGVNAPDLDKPVMNILGRVVGYMVAMISSDAIGVSCELFNTPQTPENNALLRIVTSQVEQAIEDNDLNGMARDLLRNAAVDGDACLHLFFDPNAPTGQDAAGLVKCEIVPNTDVSFGNRQECDKEKQPYILIASRRTLFEVQEEMKKNGMNKSELSNLEPDDELLHTDEADTTGDCVTVITRYTKRKGRVWVCKTTRTAVVMPETDTGYKLYPVAWMNWQKVAHRYHGQAAVTVLVPNQIAINKLFAMALKYQRENAFPKIIYDKGKLPEGWNNRLGAIAVNGDPNQLMFRYAGGQDMSSQVMEIVDKLISYTRDLMGASDAALGNVKADNTSAIIAVQQSTAVPLEIQRRSFLGMMEQTVRCMLDIITADYGMRDVLVKGDSEADGDAMVPYDFGLIGDLLVGLKVDIGSAAFWSEITQVQTLDNMLGAGIFADVTDYLEALPASRLPGKDKLIEQIKRKREEVAKNAAMSGMPLGTAAGLPGGGQGNLAMPQVQRML